jgi:hypothetical protein
VDQAEVFPGQRATGAAGAGGPARRAVAALIRSINCWSSRISSSLAENTSTAVMMIEITPIPMISGSRKLAAVGPVMAMTGPVGRRTCMAAMPV